MGETPASGGWEMILMNLTPPSPALVGQHG